MGELSNDSVVTVDAGGCVRMWEVSLTHLEKSLQQWRNMIGEGDQQLQVCMRNNTEVARDVISDVYRLDHEREGGFD